MIPASRCRLPRSATMAIFTSLTLKMASAEATRTSHAAARSTPPPTHQLTTAGITGLGQRATAVIAPCHEPELGEALAARGYRG